MSNVRNLRDHSLSSPNECTELMASESTLLSLSGDFNAHREQERGLVGYILAVMKKV